MKELSAAEATARLDRISLLASLNTVHRHEPRLSDEQEITRLLVALVQVYALASRGEVWDGVQP